MLYLEVFMLHQGITPTKRNFLHEKRQAAFEASIKEVADRGGVIAVVGWIKSYHDDITRRLQEMERVLFYHEVRGSLPKKVELVIFLSFVPVSVRDKLSKGKITTNLVFHNGEIKRMLDVIELPPEVPSKPSRKVPTVKSKKIQPILKVPSATPDWEGFVLTFSQHADQHKRKWVGRRTVGRLRDEFHITQSADQLVKLGWMVSHIGDGKTEIGWYSAGEKMGVPEPTPTPYAEVTAPSEVVPDSRIVQAQQLVVEAPVPLPTPLPVSDDPRIAKIVRLLAQEPQLRADIVKLESELKNLYDTVAKIDLLRSSVDSLELE